MVVSSCSVQAQLWIRPPYLHPVKLIVKPKTIVELGRRKTGFERWVDEKQRNHNCTFVTPERLAGGDDSWPKSLRDWPRDLSYGRKKPTEVAQELMRCYPDEPCLVNVASWIQELHHKYPDAVWIFDNYSDNIFMTSLWIILYALLFNALMT